MPYIGNQPGTGVRSRFIYTATASQTTFSGADDNSKTLKYADSAYVDVFLNGICLVPGTDYTASTKTSVVLTQAASVSDTLEVVAYDIATISDTVSQVDGGTFEAGITIRTADNTSQLTLESTDADASKGPVLELFRNSASPADNDLGGAIEFYAENDADEKIRYQLIQAYMPDVSDGSEDGAFQQYIMKDGTAIQRMEHSPTETVFNQDSADVNFRVESDGNANMFFIDGGNNIVGIGRTPDSNDGAAGSLQLEGNDGMAMRRPSQTNSFIMRPLATGDGMRFTQGGTGDRVTITSDGAVKMSGNAGTFTTGVTHTAENNAANTYTFKVRDHTTNPLAQYLVEFMYNNASPDNNTAKFLQCRDSTTARLNIDSDGDVYNHDGTYGSISDEKLKEQISDASEQWDDIKALRIRKFKFKTDVATGDSDNHWRLGVIAQEVEASGMTKLIKEEADIEVDDEGVISQTGTTTKIVKYSILYMKAVKALQEAMTRIETLETKVAALEAE